MDNNENRSYEIGYGKPPQKTQFKKGVSGNPMGRAKRVSTVRDTFIDVFNQPVKVTLGGQVQNIPGTKAIFLQLKKQMIDGKPWAFRNFINLGLKLGIFDDSNAPNFQLEGLFQSLRNGPAGGKSQK